MSEHYAARELRPACAALDLGEGLSVEHQPIDGSLRITVAAEPRLWLWVTPGWEGREGAAVTAMVGPSLDRCLMARVVHVEWTGEVEEDAARWAALVRDLVPRLLEQL